MFPYTEEEISAKVAKSVQWHMGSDSGSSLPTVCRWRLWGVPVSARIDGI